MESPPACGIRVSTAWGELTQRGEPIICAPDFTARCAGIFRMVKFGETKALALVGAMLLAGFGARAQERVVVAGGADITAMNALDQITIVPDRALMENIGDP